jgi:transposase
VSPVELIDGPFLMRHEHLAGALVERRKITKISSRSNGVLHHPPEAFRAVVAGSHVNAVSATFHFTNSALRKWVQRFANEGAQGLLDRPRSGRPRKVTCALEQHLNRLVDQDPLEHGSVHSQWSCRELAMVLAQHTGIQLGRESIRCV